MLSKHVRDAFLVQIAVGKRQLATYEPSYWLCSLEARYALFQLEQMIMECGLAVEESLFTLFEQRWQRIKNTDLQYLLDFTHPANQVYIEIAKALGTLLKRPYLTLLMPSLNATPITAYTTSSYAEDLDLKEIILSDDNERLICIPDVLDGAQVDGVLKHNSLDQGGVKILSQAEQHRLLSRHPTVRVAYEALQARVAFKLHGHTVGAALARLIAGLRGGGESRFRQDDPRRALVSYDSGMQANEAIVEFNIYLETLDDETRDILMSASKIDQYSEMASYSIEMLWNRLARPSHRPDPDPDLDPDSDSDQQAIRPPLVDYRVGGTYCVEIIANGLEVILKMHPELYDLESYHGGVGATLAELDQAVMQAGEAMHQGLLSMSQHLCHEAYGKYGQYVKLLSLLNKEPCFLLRVEEVAGIADKYAAACRKGSKRIMAIGDELLRTISQRYDQPFIMDALARMTPEGRQRFIELTGFGLSPPRLREVGGACFFGAVEKVKRNTSEASLEPSRKRFAVEGEDDVSATESEGSETHYTTDGRGAF